MAAIDVEFGRVVNARPEVIWKVIADYRVGHPAILPPPFTSLTVESGGFGAGTVVWTKLRVFGRDVTYHQRITEPEPGRLLLETDVDTGQWSSFRLEPVGGGAQTRVTIHCQFPASNPVTAFLVGLGQKPMTIRIFKDELNKLEQYIQNGAAQAQPVGA
jgi:hypothetical protein